MTKLDLSEHWEGPLLEANRLLLSGDYEQSCLTLTIARAEAKSGGRLADAAFYSSILGSFLASRNRNEEALVAYLEAENLEPSNLVSRLATARHYLQFLGRPSDARRKLDEISSAGGKEFPLEHEFHTLRGLSALRLNQIPLAIAALLKSGRTTLVSQLGEESIDLSLVEALVEARVDAEACKTFLRGLPVRENGECAQRIEGLLKQLS